MVGTVGFVCPSSFWIAAYILNSSIQKNILCVFQKHKKYTKIIDKNRLKMDSVQSRFSWIFLMKTSPDLSCIWKPLKWAFQNWSYMPKTSISKGITSILSKAFWNKFRIIWCTLFLWLLCNLSRFSLVWIERSLRTVAL